MDMMKQMYTTLKMYNDTVYGWVTKRCSTPQAATSYEGQTFMPPKGQNGDHGGNLLYESS